MDTGLNNRNTLGDIAPEFKDVVFFVEATSTEAFTLWQEWSKESMTNIEPISKELMDLLNEVLEVPSLFKVVENLNEKVKKNTANRVEWEQVCSGFMLQIGEIDKRPVSVSFSFAIINGKKICFYECTSQVADHKMIEDWLMSKFQLTHDNYTRRNHTNAGNFHNCINSLDNLDAEPRDTVYKG